MKKLMLMVALAFATLSMNAQTTVYVGAGMSTLVGSDTDGANSTFSYKVGASYDFNVGSFAIIPGIEYENKSLSLDAIDGTLSRNYIQIPVLAAYKFELGSATLGINAGPYVSYGLFGSDIEWYGGGESNIFDEFERLDAGLRVGAFFDVSNFRIGLEYNRGFTKMDSNYSQFNQVIGLTLGYQF